MKNFLFFYLVIFFFSCTSSKNTNRVNETLSFDEVEIGKDQTAVIGTVNKATEVDGKLIATITVDSMKQGGANSLALVGGSEVDIIFTEAFQRNYLDQSGNPVKSRLSDGRKILVAIKRNLRTREIQVNFFKVK